MTGKRAYFDTFEKTTQAELPQPGFSSTIMKRFSLFAFFLLASVAALQAQNWKKAAADPDYMHRAIKQVTDVIVHDIYSPPVASRIYAYVTIAGYEAARPADGNYRTFAGQLHQLQPLPAPDSTKEFQYTLAAVQALLTVGKALIISEDKIDAFQQQLLQELKNTGIPDSVFQASVAYGNAVAAHVLAWAATDNYKQSRSFPKYDVTDDAAAWKPTPPAYIKAIEPHWNTLRPFVIDSAQQFKPAPPTPFSVDKKSRFYKEAKEVHDIGLTLTAQQKDVANFWDCNPFKMNLNGHVMYATKKISPGGHWINITRLACKKAGADVVRAAEAYACVSITLADCFISCWDEKYRSNVIRPETYINQYLNEDWLPLLQTPPFPEYTSGHSVVSTASALVLTKLFGENFSYADSTETEFGLPVRPYKSFKQAAAEASISRLYGGIHYRPSIVNGIAEGEKIGLFVTRTLKMRHNTSVAVSKK
ncbi:MAG TPA: vanadium-dependent haloperoxidase [Chitinophagaceae bacterium]|nr:vanadium-dependent haloperoxidase [Chitinophagaceae bacterium]